MKVLVTGGAGFIGHNVVRLLEEQGHTVAILDNLTNADDALYSERLDGLNAKIYQSNIHDVIGRTHVSIFEPEVIIHCASAANSKAVNADPEGATKSMIIGLENMLLACKRFKVKRFIFISSSMVYGNFERPTMVESVPKAPINLYGTLKLAGERMTKLYAEEHEFEHVIIRPSAVYGPRDTRGRVIERFLTQAIANVPLKVYGEHERLDFTYVDDLALGITQAIEVDLNIWEPVFNLTRGEERSILRAAMYIQEGVNSEARIEIHPADRSMGERGKLDIGRAKKALGYNPTTSLEKGIAKYYDWIKTTYPV